MDILLRSLFTMNSTASLLAAATTTPTLTGIDWLMIALYFTILAAVAWWVVKRSKDTAADYFLAGRAISWLVGHRRVHFWLPENHRLRAHYGAGGLPAPRKSGAGGLRVARLRLLGAGVGVRPLLHAVAGVHDARVSGAALLRQITLRALVSIVDHVCRLEDCGGNFYGAWKFATLLPEHASERGRGRGQQFLDWVHTRDCAHGALHHAGRDARGGLQRRAVLAIVLITGSVF